MKEDEATTKRKFEYCPTCGGDLDTGWECTKCGLDWRDTALVDEVQRCMDAVVDAAVAWHQSGQEGDNTWFDKGEALGQAIDRLLEMRSHPASADKCSHGIELGTICEMCDYDDSDRT